MKDERVSAHSDLRSMQRVGFDVNLSDLWEDSIPCEVKHHGYDEARVSPEEGVVLLMSNDTIVTVLYVGSLEVEVSPDHLQEYLERSIEDDV